MCEVTSQNFEEKYPEIMDNLQSALFISIDCEFSGLYDDECKCSLFDSPRTRFNKLQKSLENLIIVQMGLSTFKYERDSNSFTVSTYTLYLKSTTLLENSKFLCHSRSIEFLCKHKFDFNKLFYDGINYLNKSKEAELLRMIEDRSLVNVENTQEVQSYCSRVAQWCSSAPFDSEMLLELNESPTFVYLLHQEIRKRFTNLWTYLGEPNVIKIRKVEASEKRKLLLNQQEDLSLKKKLFDSISGFSRIVKELQNLKKPIVGHNFLTDLILIYKQFYNPSPLSYKEFKKVIRNIFPHVYDTKTISFEMRKILPKDSTWDSNTLPDLYNYLTCGRGATIVIFSPKVNDTNEEFLSGKNFHEAGFDSYCTGYCFLKMAHILSLWSDEKKSFMLTSLPTSSAWLLSAVRPMRNKVNLIRARVNHIALDDEDPKSIRPDLLFIRSKTNLPLDVLKVSEEIAKYAVVDIQLLSKYSGLMALSNAIEVREVLEYFKNHQEVEVTKYSFLKHSGSGRLMVHGTIIASVVFIGIWALKCLNKV